MRRRAVRGLLAACLLAGCESGTIGGSGAVPPVTTLRVSLSGADTEADLGGEDGKMSGDGRRVVFTSRATNLHPDAPGGVGAVYVKDLVTREIYLASRASGPAGAPALGISAANGISRDGRRVAFTTVSSLDPDDTDAVNDVYVRDLETHQTILVSRASGASGAKANQDAREGLISPDGLVVAFATLATNLDGADTDGVFDIYARDLVLLSTELVSRDSGAAGTKANRACWPLGLSEDGSRVLFRTTLYSFTANPPFADPEQVYVRDRVGTPRTILVSRADGASGAPGDGFSLLAAITPDGRRVAFSSGAVNLHPEDVDPSVDIFLRDLQEDTIELVSRASGVDGVKASGNLNQPSRVSISGDGRFVAFDALSGNLVLGDSNASHDVFVRDRLHATTTRVSVRTFNSQISGAIYPSLSESGTSVVFTSLATDIVDDDGNGFVDVFVRSPLRWP